MSDQPLLPIFDPVKLDWNKFDDQDEVERHLRFTLCLREIAKFPADSPAEPNEKGLVFPQPLAIKNAADFCRACQPEGLIIGPDRIMPEVSGGIALYWANGKDSRSITFLPDGQIEVGDYDKQAGPDNDVIMYYSAANP
jgi:hypothetical protein